MRAIPDIGVIGGGLRMAMPDGQQRETPFFTDLVVAPG
jgi:hypothetical protein